MNHGSTIYILQPCARSDAKRSKKRHQNQICDVQKRPLTIKNNKPMRSHGLYRNRPPIFWWWSHGPNFGPPFWFHSTHNLFFFEQPFLNIKSYHSLKRLSQSHSNCNWNLWVYLLKLFSCRWYLNFLECYKVDQFQSSPHQRTNWVAYIWTKFQQKCLKDCDLLLRVIT